MNIMENSELIASLCESAASRITIHDLGCVTSPGYGQTNLIASGIEFHKLNKSELAISIIGLAKLLSPPPMLVCVNDDHLYLWAWCAQIFSDSNTPIREEIPYDVLSFMRLVTHTALCIPNLQLRQGGRVGVHGRSSINGAHRSLLYLTLPLLEALLRCRCRKHVERDGTVKMSFSKGLGTNVYKPNDRCSNLADLIRLCRSEHSTFIAESCAIELFAVLERNPPNVDIATWLFTLRNGALHGEDFGSNAAALVLSICFALCLDEISSDVYASERDRVYEGVLWGRQFSDRADWHIYPPEY